MRFNRRKFRRDTKAIIELVGIILMLGVVVATATAFHLSVSQNTSSKLKNFPIVTLRQREDTIVVINIQFGPVYSSEIRAKIEDENGNSIGVAELHNPGLMLFPGDYFKITGVNSEELYEFVIYYQENQIGNTRYINH